MTDIPNDPRESMLTTERPWGMYEQFCLNERVSVKTITVNPGHRLSLQTHENRAEFSGARRHDRRHRRGEDLVSETG